MNNVKVKHYILVKTGNVSSFDDGNTFSCLIFQLDETVAPLYPDVNVESSFRCITNYENIKAGDKLVIVDSNNSEFNNNDSFIVYKDFVKSKIIGNVIYSGIIIKE
jgi:hypothetical protein